MPNYAIEIKKDELNPTILIKCKQETIAEVLFQGATLNSLIINNSNRLFGYDSSQAIDFSDCRNSFLFPFPNRIRDGNYKFENVDYRFPINEPARNNAIHGFLKEQFFELFDYHLDDNFVKMKLAYQYPGDWEYYPFPFVVEVTYVISSSTLDLHFLVKNTGLSKMPIGFGWHPYFQNKENPVNDMILKLPDVDEIKLDQRALPTDLHLGFKQFMIPKSIGADTFDSLFLLNQLNDGLSWEFADDGLHMKMSYDQSIKYIQLYTPDSRKSIAIEPMTCSIDAFNSGHGLVELAPNHEFIINIDLKWS